MNKLIYFNHDRTLWDLCEGKVCRYEGRIFVISSVVEIKLSMEQPEMCNAGIDAPICNNVDRAGLAPDGNLSEAALKLKTSLIEAERLLRAIKMDFKNLQTLANDECTLA